MQNENIVKFPDNFRDESDEIRDFNEEMYCEQKNRKEAKKNDRE